MSPRPTLEGILNNQRRSEYDRDEVHRAQRTTAASRKKQRIPKRQTPFSKAFVEFIPTDWAPIPTSCPNRSARRLRLPHTVMP
ncbi:Xaa-Pro aminopeptidase [Cutibacterium acnes JCM 18918]|nr:Xaa-Pro aminopeptidase [Cutibacterium acnes JCM 18918]